MSEEPFVSPVAPGDVVAGKFRVERILGAGAMGVVVAATHINLGQLVALKFLRPEILQDYRDIADRFLREAQTVFQLQSQHVARVIDVGVESIGGERTFYLAMEYLEGSDLRELLDDRGALPVDEISDYALQICDALAEAHALGIVHRDIKPENLFLAKRSGRAPVVKVLDFGIALAMSGAASPNGGRLTAVAEVMGTPPYMSPEQTASARNVDSRSDVWTLGVVLYELATGRLPFDGASHVALCAAILTAPPAPMIGIDPTFEAIVLRCLEKEPANRFESATEVAEALRPLAREAPGSGAFASGAHPARASASSSSPSRSGARAAVAAGTKLGLGPTATQSASVEAPPISKTLEVATPDDPDRSVRLAPTLRGSAQGTLGASMTSRDGGAVEPTPPTRRWLLPAVAIGAGALGVLAFVGFRGAVPSAPVPSGTPPSVEAARAQAPSSPPHASSVRDVDSVVPAAASSSPRPEPTAESSAAPTSVPSAAPDAVPSLRPPASLPVIRQTPPTVPPPRPPPPRLATDRHG